MGRRTVLLVVAILVAALGTGLVFAYVRSTDERALRDQEPVQVLVAKSLIKAGTSGTQAEREGAFRLQAIPRVAVAEGYLTETRSIAPLVAVSDIFPGEQILVGKFATAGSTSVLPIPPGKAAMSVQLGDPQRVAGFVRPGSKVAVIVTLRIEKQEGRSFSGDLSRVLLPSVDVLAVGPTTLRPQTTEQANTEPLPTAILTLAVTQREAQKLALSVERGKLYFMLLTDDSKVGPGQPIHLDNLFS